MKSNGLRVFHARATGLDVRRPALPPDPHLTRTPNRELSPW